MFTEPSIRCCLTMIKTMVKLDCAVVEGGHFGIVFALTLLLEPAYLGLYFRFGLG